MINAISRMINAIKGSGFEQGIVHYVFNYQAIARNLYVIPPRDTEKLLKNVNF
jgi:hypothetical protein